MSASGRRWPWWRFALTALSTLALALSAYLGWHYLTGGSVIGCTGGSSCDQVLSSRWSSVAGVVPVAGLAAGTYLAILLASFFVGPATSLPDRRLAWGAMLILVGAAAGSAVYFVIVQKWLIGAFCPYCIATHITGLLLGALVFWRALVQTDDSSPITKQRVLRPLPAISLAIIGVALAGILAACQFAFSSRGAYQVGNSPANLPTVDPHAALVVGSPDAPYVVTLLFDYKCPHCQKVHSMLDEAVGRYHGKLAFVLCPTPLESRCNPYVARDVEEFSGSCDLAKIALTVWASKHEAFADFDRWMFSPEPGERWRPRSLEAARAKAIELVGQQRFDAAQADPWIDRYMQNSIAIFGSTIRGGNAVPRLIFGSRWITPEPRDANELVSILHSSLNVPEP
jgi:uncharacterized membrane protein/thiol-disulfide isomerase/thioredoxin